MKERAEAKGFTFPYLYDESQKIGRELGASVTPEFFVLNKERKVVYMGAMDDKMNSPTVNYLEQAVEAALKGEKPAKTECACAWLLGEIREITGRRDGGTALSQEVRVSRPESCSGLVFHPSPGYFSWCFP